MTLAMGQLATRDTSVSIPDQERGDEIGAMARAVIVFREAMRAGHESALRERAIQHDREERRVKQQGLVTEFVSQMDVIVASLSKESGGLEADAADVNAECGHGCGTCTSCGTPRPADCKEYRQATLAAS